MKKRFLQVLTAVAFMLLIFSFSAFAGDGITDAAEKRYDAAVAYLNEFYIKKNPEAALTVYQGSYKDKQTLKNAAKKITKGAKTDEQKAKKIYNWVAKNVSYNKMYSSLSADVYNNRKTQCYGYANLTRDLLRYAGVPAVTVTGWRADMTGYKSQKELYSLAEKGELEGHAWNMVYLNGKWEFIDALWGDFKLKKKSIVKSVYFAEVENIVPYYKGVYIDGEAMCYKDGKIVCLDKKGKPSDVDIFKYNNNIAYDWPHSAYKYRKTDGKKKLSDDKITGKAGTYVRYPVFESKIALAPIKIKPDGTIQNYHAFTYKKNTVLATISGGAVFLDIPVKEVEFATGGILKLDKGEKIRMYPALDSVKEKHGITYKYFSEDTTVVTVDKNGYMKGKSFGNTVVGVKMYDEEGMCFHTELLDVSVSDGKTTIADGPSGYAKDIKVEFTDSTTVKLMWKAEDKEDITEFVILKRDTNGNFNYAGKTKGTSFVLEDVEKSYAHEIKIKAVLKRKGGVSTSYSIVSFHGTPERVQGLNYEKIEITGDSASVGLYWYHIGDASPYYRTDIFNHYQIYQLKDGKWKKIGTSDVYDLAAFTVKNLKPGKTYSFKVRAVGIGEYSGEKICSTYGKFSKVLKVTVPENIGTVKNVKKSLSGTTLTLSWDAVRNADSYMVYKYNDKKDKWEKVATETDTRVTFNNISKNKTHQYKVRAYNKTEEEMGVTLVKIGAFSKVIKVKA